VPLNVSGAWHSELMAPAQERFAPFVERARIAPPRLTVISTVDAQPYRDVESIRRNLVRSVTAGVLWHETALRMIAEGLDLIVEFGASPVLAPMMKRLPGVPPVLHVGDRGGLAKLHDALTTSPA
jgi:[acyl-carrier-protein] S-malonyltransferase